MKYRIAMLFGDKVSRSELISSYESCVHIIKNGPLDHVKSIWIEAVR